MSTTVEKFSLRLPPPIQPPPPRWMVVGHELTAGKLHRLLRKHKIPIPVSTPSALSSNTDDWIWVRDSAVCLGDGTALLPNPLPLSQILRIDRQINAYINSTSPHLFGDRDNTGMYGTGFLEANVACMATYLDQHHISYTEGESRIEGGNCFVFESHGKPTAVVGDLSFEITRNTLADRGTFKNIREIEEQQRYTHNLMAKELKVAPDRLFRVTQKNFHLDLELARVDSAFLLNSPRLAADAAARYLPPVYARRLHEQLERSETTMQRTLSDLEMAGLPVHLVPGVFDPSPLKPGDTQLPVINFLNGISVRSPSPCYIFPDPIDYPDATGHFTTLIGTLAPATRVFPLRGFDAFLTEKDGGLRCLTNGCF